MSVTTNVPKGRDWLTTINSNFSKGTRLRLTTTLITGLYLLVMPPDTQLMLRPAIST